MALPLSPSPSLPLSLPPQRHLRRTRQRLLLPLLPGTLPNAGESGIQLPDLSRLAQLRGRAQAMCLLCLNCNVLRSE